MTFFVVCLVVLTILAVGALMRAIFGVEDSRDDWWGDEDFD